MNKEQMIAWLTLEGHTIHMYGPEPGNSGLWEANINGQGTCRYTDQVDTWSYPLGGFDGGREISWSDLPEDVIRDLLDLLQRYDQDTI